LTYGAVSTRRLIGGSVAPKPSSRSRVSSSHSQQCGLSEASDSQAQARREEALPHLADARESFQQLEAMPWLERLDALETSTRAEVTA
jgi:hypothetical protein